MRWCGPFLISLSIASAMAGATANAQDLLPGYASKEIPLEMVREDLKPLDEGMVTSFLAPNEIQPKHARPILEASPRGLYVAVGTERGFMGAAMTPSAEGLLLLDVDPRVVLYNRVNIELLKGAPTRELYLYLRLAGNYAEWKKKIDAPWVTEDVFKWWKRATRLNPMFEQFPFHSDPRRPRTGGKPHPFDEVNYLYYDEPFGRLRKMALEGKIESHEVDLSKPQELQAVARCLKQNAGATVGVLDLSNAWWKKFMGGPGLQRTVEIFRSVSVPETQVMLSSVAHDFKKDVLVSHQNDVREWGYFSFSMERLSDPERARKIYDQLYKVDGRYYRVTAAQNGSIDGMRPGKWKRLRGAAACWSDFLRGIGFKRGLK